MSTTQQSPWAEELKENGWPRLLESRLAFHGRLWIQDVSQATGRGIHTTRKHFRCLVESGKAQWFMRNGEPGGIEPIKS